MCSSCSVTNWDCWWCSGFTTVLGLYCFLRGRPDDSFSISLAWRNSTAKAAKGPPWQWTCLSERDKVHQPALWQAQIQTNPATSLYSSDTSGTLLEAATVITTFRDLPFYHMALTEIQHDEMTVLLVPYKLSFKWILYKKNPQMNLPFLSQLLVTTSLLDSSARRASLTDCEQGPGEYNYEWAHHKENNHKRL